MFLCQLLVSFLRFSCVASFLASTTRQNLSRRKSSSPSSLLLMAPQLLEFQEPRTNVTVVLVGAMHYNPASIALAVDTVDRLGRSNALGSVIVEQCEIRWNKTLELLQERPYLEPLYNTALSNEMRKACDTALAYNRPVILGDQLVNLTFSSIKSTAQQTAKDLFRPPQGWKQLYQDVKESFDIAVPLGDGYLNAVSLLDTRLLMAAPISFVKYPLSFLVRNPITTSIAFSILYAIGFLDQSTTLDSLVGGEASVIDMTLSFLISALETIFVARIFLKPMLEERNVILAQNILEQCKIYQVAGKQPKTNWWDGIWSNNQIEQPSKEAMVLDEIVYAPESKVAGICLSNSDGSAKTVVAVLGMAHCNGIKKLLVEQRI